MGTITVCARKLKHKNITKNNMKTTTSNKTVRRSPKIKRAKSYALKLVAGTVIGGIVPAITYGVAHYQTQANPALWVAVAGGLAYSAPTVAAWFTRYSGQIKAWGFVISLEAALTFTQPITALPALAVLVGLNAFILANRFAQD